MKNEARRSLKVFLIELVIYAALVVAYFFLVLRFLGGWLAELYQSDRYLYAGLALGLIVCQGILLETITTALVALIRSRQEEQ